MSAITGQYANQRYQNQSTYDNSTNLGQESPDPQTMASSYDKDGIITY